VIFHVDHINVGRARLELRDHLTAVRLVLHPSKEILKRRWQVARGGESKFPVL
jgi:hypothetical protein